VGVAVEQRLQKAVRLRGVALHVDHVTEEESDVGVGVVVDVAAGPFDVVGGVPPEADRYL
jgi:hypothetical protein